jgi:hypothetical protein
MSRQPGHYYYFLPTILAFGELAIKEVMCIGETGGFSTTIIETF